MARILIGNIRGPVGPEGKQGPQGKQGIQGPAGPLPPLVNNALTTEAGIAALDAAMGKTLGDQVTQLYSNLTGKTGSFGWTLDLCTVINKQITERAGRVTIVLYGIRTSPIGAANTEIELGTISGVTMPPFPIRVNAATGTEVYYCVNNAYAALSTAGKIKLRLQNSTDRAFIINFEYAV